MQKILVVDDEFSIGEVLREALSDEGYQVSLAINGRLGLELVAKERPDLVLLDFMMPVLNGAEMLKAMMADPSVAHIPVIFMSSLPEASVAARAQGHIAFMRKPFDLDTIIAMAASVLASRQ